MPRSWKLHGAPDPSPQEIGTEMVQPDALPGHASPLPQQACVVVIGGGISGCSTLYHLTEMGMKDVVLLEKSQLTAGSSWHAAGMMSHYGKDVLMTSIIANSGRLYEEFA